MKKYYKTILFVFLFITTTASSQDYFEIANKDRFYAAFAKDRNALVGNNGIKYINVYNKPFMMFETEVIEKIKCNVSFSVYVGLEDAGFRKIITPKGYIGWVRNDQIEIVGNDRERNNFYMEQENINLKIDTKDILLEKLIKNKSSKKADIAENLELELSILTRDNRNFLSVKVSTTNPNYNIITRRELIGLYVPAKLNINAKNTELIYNDDNKYLDAMLLPYEFEDYMYEFVKFFSDKIVGAGISGDAIEKLAKAIGIGEFEEDEQIANFTCSTESQFICNTYGSCISNKGWKNPNANSLQIIYPVYNSVTEINNLINKYGLKLFIGLNVNNFNIVLFKDLIVPETNKPNNNYTDLLLSEDFEDNQLHHLISINKIGSYKKAPGIDFRNEFGGSYCYGFGKSTCSASCFDSYATEMIIDLGRATYVKNLTFNVMELNGDWGSSGQVYIDGVKVKNVQLGSSPSNDGKPDYKPRKITIDVNSNTTEIKIRVYDITNRSEIFIDDLKVYGGK